MTVSNFLQEKQKRLMTELASVIRNRGQSEEKNGVSDMTTEDIALLQACELHSFLNPTNPTNDTPKEKLHAA